MKHRDFGIGRAFFCGGCKWLCTGIGSRVVTAIRLDPVEARVGEQRDYRALSEDQARAEGWFKGPPYGLAETVFDENDFGGCTARELASTHHGSFPVPSHICFPFSDPQVARRASIGD